MPSAQEDGSVSAITQPVQVLPARTDFVEHVAQLAPVFVAPPSRDKEFTRPVGWQHTPRRSVDEALRGWRDGWAICAVLGAVLVVVDVDPRNGGDPDQVRSTLNVLGVRVFAEVDTPSGGKHFYVAADPGLKSTKWRGVDILGPRRHVFLPGTLRHIDGERRGYEVVLNNLAALADGGDPDGAETLASWAAAQSEQHPKESPDVSRASITATTSAYAAKAFGDEVGRLAVAAEGIRNDTLNKAAFSLAQLVAGGCLDHHKVWHALHDMALHVGLTEAETDNTLRSAFAAGMTEPRTAPERESVAAATVFDDAVTDMAAPSGLDVKFKPGGTSSSTPRRTPNRSGVRVRKCCGRTGKRSSSLATRVWGRRPSRSNSRSVAVGSGSTRRCSDIP